MVRFIIKPEKDRDFYIEWSTIVDHPMSWGTRDNMFGPGDDTRLERADMYGSTGLEGHWEDSSFVVYNRGLVPLSVKREDLINFVLSIEGQPDDYYDPRYASILRDDEDETPIEDIEPPC
jgi:hypothetical protein